MVSDKVGVRPLGVEMVIVPVSFGLYANIKLLTPGVKGEDKIDNLDLKKQEYSPLSLALLLSMI